MKNKKFVYLLIPIYLENILRTALQSVDVVMLSRFSDEAVAAVGFVSQLSFFVLVLFMTVSSATSIILTQLNGAGKHKDALNVIVASIRLSFIVGVGFSFVLFFFHQEILSFFPLDSQTVTNYAFEYFSIFSVFSFLMALSVTFSAILRSYGYAKQTMYTNLATNVVNIIGNYLFLFGSFGFPKLGVAGVAISTMFSYLLASLILFALIIKSPTIPLKWRKYPRIDFQVYKKLILLGLPSSAESISYNMSKTVSSYFIVSLGTVSLAAQSYVVLILRFVLMFSLSVAQTSQLKVGYYCGSGQYNDSTRVYKKSLLLSYVVTILSISVVVVFRYPILNFFTDNQEIVTIGATILLFAIVEQTGSVLTLVMTHCTLATGDVYYPLKIGLVSMWVVSVGVGYYFAIYLGLGLIGIWIGKACDEWVRGILLIRRWRANEWIELSQKLVAES